ncbi:MAG: FecR family protein [Enhydrobacter sp.]|nr:FecR family protein [Enhydrobacter sp.]
MSTPASDPNIHLALDWLLRLQASPSDEGLRAAAEAWRAQDPEHARAWKRAERAWNYAAGELAETERERPVPVAVPSGRPWEHARRAAPLLALLVAVIIGLVFWSGRADYATTTAELRAVTLEDGTRIELAGETSIDVAFTASERSVRLLKGEAFFDVRADAKRPFEVKAADLSIKVVGTAFNVRLSSSTTAVAVAEGVVEARYAGQPVPTTLTKGEVVEVGRDGGSIRQATISPADVAPWRGHQLIVHGAPLREVVADIRRYSGTWIIFDDSRLAGQQVSGVYDLHEPERALRLLVGPFGGKVREITPFVRVISGP